MMSMSRKVLIPTLLVLAALVFPALTSAQDNTLPVPPGRIRLRVDAGLAFGTGAHATTEGCLLALDRLGRERRFRRPLDLGCGSGVLGLAILTLMMAVNPSLTSS